MLLIKTLRDTLLKPLQSVIGVVERRHTLPILSNVLIERRGKTLSFLATDIEIQIIAHAEQEAPGEDYEITVGARKIVDILRALPDTAEVALNAEDKRLTIKAGKSRFSVQVLPAADFPKMTIGVDESHALQVPQKELRALFQLVQYAMAQQDIRYYLNGMLLIADGNTLRVVATDGHRLAYAATQTGIAFAHQESIIPRKTIIELTKLLDDSNDPVTIHFGANQARFSFSGIEVTTKLVDGKFPDYERVIPANYTKAITLDRMLLLQTLQRAAILTNEKFKGVRCVLSDGSLKVICTNAEQEEAQEELEVDYKGETIDIGFNVSYLLDVLNNISDKEIVCQLGDANSSALFTLPGKESFKYVVMPMRI